MEDDLELLREFTSRGSEEAFRTLVDRHVGLVHGAARRLTRDDHFAEEITQAVFTLLARKASTLPPTVVVAGWLHRTTRFVALQGLRSERRRQRHHDQFAHMSTLSEADAAWEQISPCLEDGISQLSDSDRDAVVLRFLEGRDIAEVARALGTTEAAAKMRVSRAVEKLRVLLGRRGAIVSGAVLLAALTTHGATSAPPGLSASAAAAALSPGAIGATSLSLVKATLTIMAWNKTKTIALTALIALFLAGGTAVLWRGSIRPLESSRAQPSRPLTIATFAPMDGEWEGTFEMRQDNQPPTRQRTILLIQSKDTGRVCEIEMQIFSRGPADPDKLIFTHTLSAAGDSVFTTSDARTGRGDGDGRVTESFENKSANEWRAAIHFPYANHHGAMDGLWHRRGDELHITSHDELYLPGGTNHLFADIRLRRRAGTTRDAASLP